MQIGPQTITRDGPLFIMAEIGVNHDGSLDIARQLIDAAHHAGAHAVKFQLFDADLLLAATAGLVDYQRTAATSADDLLRPLQLSAAQLKPLVAHAHQLNLLALITPFSIDLVAPAKSTGCDGIKLASPDLVNHPLLEAAIATGLPLVLSSGAASMDEIARTLNWVGDVSDRTILLHCVSSYPTPSELATLGAIPTLRHAFPQLPIGYSDHTTSTLSGAFAVAAGACFLEKHLTLDRTRPGPDHAASLEPAQLADYVRLAQEAYLMRGPYEKKIQDVERPIRTQTRQSVVLRRALPANTKLSLQDLTVKRPGTGIPAAGLRDIVGRRLAHPLAANTVLTLSDLADPEE